MTATALDHVGVVTRDLTSLGGLYERLGFTLSPFARQSDGRIGNRCAMLRRGYIELLAVVDANAGSATLDRFLSRYAGIHILALAMTDEQATLARLRRAGMVGSNVLQLDRSIDHTRADEERARFTLIAAPQQPEGRINLVRHLTPELLWQDHLLRHPNNADQLAEVFLAVADLSETAARFSRIAGCSVLPDPVGGVRLGLARGRVRLVSETSLARLFPGVAVPVPPMFVGVAIQTNDANAAIGGIVVERGIAHSQRPDALVVEPSEAGGVAIRFVPAA